MHGNIPGSGEKFWTEERIAELRRLAGEKMFARDIAAEIGTTKNSVLGKLHRLGLSKAKALPTRKPKISRRDRPKRNGGAAVAALKARKEQEATDLPQEQINHPTVSLHDLQSHHCRWPIGDPASPGFGFCGDAIRDESVPYCTHHCRIAYRGKPAWTDYHCPA